MQTFTRDQEEEHKDRVERQRIKEEAKRELLNTVKYEHRKTLKKLDRDSKMRLERA
jgi:hypothetical protein